MQLDIVTPERQLVSADVSSVMLPGSEGDMTVLADHAPLIATLRPGILRVNGPDGEQDYVVTGGFAEVTAEGASVLAEQAMPLKELTREMVDGFVAEAQAGLEAAKEKDEQGLVDNAAKLVADMVALGDQVRG